MNWVGGWPAHREDYACRPVCLYIKLGSKTRGIVIGSEIPRALRNVVKLSDSAAICDRRLIPALTARDLQEKAFDRALLTRHFNSKARPN